MLPGLPFFIYCTPQKNTDYDLRSIIQSSVTNRRDYSVCYWFAYRSRLICRQHDSNSKRTCQEACSSCFLLAVICNNRCSYLFTRKSIIMIKELTLNIFGNNSLAYWISALIFGAIGFLFYKWVTYNPTNKKESPDVFSWTYWIQNNYSDMIGGALTFFIWIRFKNEIFQAFNNDAVSVWLIQFTDTFFIHLMFGIFFTDIIRRTRKALKKKK